MTEAQPRPDAGHRSGGGDDPRRPAPFLPDEADARRDPETGEIQIDEPDLGDRLADEPEVQEPPSQETRDRD
jgi:hypothetical protein